MTDSLVCSPFDLGWSDHFIVVIQLLGDGISTIGPQVPTLQAKPNKHKKLCNIYTMSA